MIACTHTQTHMYIQSIYLSVCVCVCSSCCPTDMCFIYIVKILKIRSLFSVLIDKNTEIRGDSSAPLTFTCLSFFVSEQLCGVVWDKMPQKTTLLSTRSTLTNMPTSDLKLRSWQPPLTALTTSYGTLGTGGWIPKMRAKDGAIEGHIYISVPRPVFWGSWRRQRSYWVLKNE